MPSVVVPAHNEERVLGRLLAALLGDRGPATERAAGEAHGHIPPLPRSPSAASPSRPPDDLEVIVVANGCSDATARVAAEFAGVRVAETPVASKSAALRLGDGMASSFPRLYVDADVVFDGADLRRLCQALETPGLCAAGPRRVFPMDGVALLVRWYYDVWQRLPSVREELFGRGVIAVDRQGHERLASLLTGDAEIMSDDLAIAMSFDRSERVVVDDAGVEIRPPRTYADLMRRRVRAMTGNARLASGTQGVPGPRRAAPRTGPRELLGVVAREPGVLAKVRLAPKVGVFLVTAVVSRLRARRATSRQDAAWLRDESSRTS